MVFLFFFFGLVRLVCEIYHLCNFDRITISSRVHYRTEQQKTDYLKFLEKEISIRNLSLFFFGIFFVIFCFLLLSFYKLIKDQSTNNRMKVVLKWAILKFNKRYTNEFTVGWSRCVMDLRNLKMLLLLASI